MRLTQFKGFALIELMIVSAMIMIGISLFVGYTTKGEISVGINGVAEERCIAGYKHSIGSDRSARQVLDHQGRGIPCQ